MAQDNSYPQTPSRAGRGSGLRYFLWGFGCVAVLAGGVLVGLNLYHRQFQLTREKLEKARALWKAASTHHYDAEVTVTGSTSGVYAIRVRNDQIVNATQNRQPFEPLSRAYPWTVVGLFDIVLEQDLANDAKPDSPAAYTQVHFDQHDGHLVRYIRAGGNQRVQIDVQLTALP